MSPAARVWRCNRGRLGSAGALRGGALAGLVPRHGAGDPRVLARAGRLPAQHRGAPRRPAVLVLRGPADRERDAGRAPRPRARLQGPDPALQDHARLPRPPEGRLGHARPPRRARGRARARPARQARHRGVRRRRLQRPVPRVRVPLRHRLGADDRAHRLLDRHRRRLRDLLERVRRVVLVGTAAAVGERPDLPRLPRDPALPALRHQPLEPRDRARLPGGHARPERDRAVHPRCQRRERGRRRGAAPRRRRPDVRARVDHDAVDAAGQHRARRRARGRVRARRGRRPQAHRRRGAPPRGAARGRRQRRARALRGLGARRPALRAALRVARVGGRRDARLHRRPLTVRRARRRARPPHRRRGVRRDRRRHRRGAHRPRVRRGGLRARAATRG